jgi:G:T-mismatch repair DNA endonuclease (very short patch repair protein)
MSRIRGKDTSPELIVRSLLHRMGYRFRLHRKIEVRSEKLEVGRGKAGVGSEKMGVGKLQAPNSKLQASRPLIVRPDIVLPKYKTAIFAHGW